MSLSESRRLGYEHPEWTFSKATPTSTRPGLHSFCSCTTLVHILFQLVYSCGHGAAWFYLLFLDDQRPAASLYSSQPGGGVRRVKIEDQLQDRRRSTARSTLDTLARARARALPAHSGFLPEARRPPFTAEERNRSFRGEGPKARNWKERCSSGLKLLNDSAGRSPTTDRPVSPQIRFPNRHFKFGRQSNSNDSIPC